MLYNQDNASTIGKLILFDKILYILKYISNFTFFWLFLLWIFAYDKDVCLLLGILHVILSLLTGKTEGFFSGWITCNNLDFFKPLLILGIYVTIVLILRKIYYQFIWTKSLKLMLWLIFTFAFLLVITFPLVLTLADSHTFSKEFDNNIWLILFLSIFVWILLSFCRFLINKYRIENAPSSTTAQAMLSEIPVSHISSVRFSENSWKSYAIQLDSIKQIAVFIADKAWKTVFAPGELSEERDFLLKNYKSSLPKKDYDILVQYLSTWVEKGGSFEIIKKDL